MKPRIEIDHICALAHLKLTEGEKALEQARRIDRKKLPIGLQIMGNFFQESRLFKLAFLLEKQVKFRTNTLAIKR